MKKFIVGVIIVGIVAVFYGCGNDNNKNGYDFSNKEKSIHKLEENYTNLKSYYLTIDDTTFKDGYYKITLEKSTAVYYGDIKDNRPDGEGILFVNGTLIYAGGFEDGAYSGFGIKYGNYEDIDRVMREYKVVYPSYIGYFKEGKWNGKGNAYMPTYYPPNANEEDGNTFISNNRNKLDEAVSKGRFTSLDIPMAPTRLYASGEMKDNDFDGDVKTYYKNGNLKTDGEYDEGQMDGDGVLYYENGQVKYKGELSDNKYNGDGKLYSEDGTLIFKGKFRDGEPA